MLSGQTLHSAAVMHKRTVTDAKEVCIQNCFLLNLVIHGIKKKNGEGRPDSLLDIFKLKLVFC